MWEYNLKNRYILNFPFVKSCFSIFFLKITDVIIIIFLLICSGINNDLTIQFKEIVILSNITNDQYLQKNWFYSITDCLLFFHNKYLESLLKFQKH